MSRQLDQMLQELDREIPPSRDLWPDIERGLDRTPLPAPKPRPWLPWALAASLLLTTVGGFVGGRLSSPDPRAPLLGVLTQIQQQHASHRERLESRLAPALMAVNGQQGPGSQAAADALASVRSAEQELYSALLQEPDNRELMQLWLWVQQRELELIQKQQQRHLRLQHL